MTDLPPYSPGQLKHLERFVRAKPRWLVLGGPSCATEAQTASRLWPGLRVLGVEPNERMIEWQRRRGFPGELLHGALSDASGRVPFFNVQGAAGGFVVPDSGVPTSVMVPAFTLDELETRYGPFEDAVLWLDIEGSELAALRGATDLLTSGRVQILNLEFCDRNPEDGAAVASILAANGYRLADVWNQNSGAHHDEVWVRA